MTDATFQTADERELDILAHVHHAHEANEHQSQRSIALALGMSVGLTNAILRRLVDKGFLMMRRINQHNARYLVTPAGIEQISRRSYLYLRRTIGHVVRYKERLREFCRSQAEVGIREIVLVGESDLAFLLEWCAEKEGIRFRHTIVEPVLADGVGDIRLVLSESVSSTSNPSVDYLQRVVMAIDS